MDTGSLAGNYDTCEDLDSFFVALTNANMNLNTVAHFELVATFLEVFVSNFFQQLLIHVLCSLLLGDSFQVWA